MAVPTPIPATIGAYRILGKLGSGGMATVYKAIQEPLGRTVAIKVVAAHLTHDQPFKDRFLHEARIMASLANPYVVTCYDAGIADGHLFMALELMTGGDLLELMTRRGGFLPESLALSLIRDALLGLEAFEAARLLHRDLKPANIFLTDLGKAKLADLGLVRVQGSDRMTMAGMVMGTPAYISPEQARGDDDLDVRSDLFSLGATWFHLVTGTVAYSSDSPMGTLMKVLNDPVPDVRSRKPEIGEGTATAILKLMDKDRTRRPTSARAARDLVEGLMAQGPSTIPRIRTPLATGAIVPIRVPTIPTFVRQPTPPPPSVVTPAATSDPQSSPTQTPSSATGTVVRNPLVTAQTGRISVAQLSQLTKRIQIDRAGLKAALALAPGASFPRDLLDQLVAAAGITYGLIEANLAAAGKPAPLPRRIILAAGDPPTPDSTGRSVMGEVLPALPDAVTIRVTEDGMTANALYRGRQPPTRFEVEHALEAAGVLHGRDEKVLMRFTGAGQAPPVGGKLTVARGTSPILAHPAGFRLPVATSEDSVPGVPGLSLVKAGAILAMWQDGIPGTPGVDVFGRKLLVADVEDRDPDLMAGEGTEPSRNRDGDLVLRATRDGVVQQQPDGVVRVVGIMEIPGDLAPDAPPIATDDLVVVRGSVRKGAQITSTSDVVILGDLEDAKITSGGHLEVSGGIGAGGDLQVAGTVLAATAADRRILAGNIRITGELRGCTLVATGDITAERVVGGSLTAGGDIQVGSVGESSGIPTTLWAGHCDSQAEIAGVVELQEKSHLATREKMLARGQHLATAQQESEGRQVRLSQSKMVDPNALAESQAKISELERERLELDRARERERQELLKVRQRRQQAEAQSDGARIKIGQVAYDGAVLRVANKDPVILTEPRLRFSV